jgi:hypothetical protein
MADEEARKPSVGGDYIQATIGDNVHQVAVGKDIVQQQHIGGSVEITETDLEQVRQLFAELKQQIEQAAPPEKKSAAMERVSELENELASKKPTLTTFEYVRSWFGKNLPSLLGAVTSVLVNPIVGKVVEAAGEIAAGELKRHFGQQAGSKE